MIKHISAAACQGGQRENFEGSITVAEIKIDGDGEVIILETLKFLIPSNTNPWLWKSRLSGLERMKS